ncbi:MAG: FHA domain-containing protein [Planctomycetota bacterium]|nr:MAG: FHA domain-containing protein [Planctomycetota bacterium]
MSAGARGGADGDGGRPQPAAHGSGVLVLDLEVAGRHTVHRFDARRPVHGGRLESNDLPIAHPDVSRRHFRIRPCEHGFEIDDLDSRNGLLLNGVRVDGSAALLPGDRIGIGPHVRIRFLGARTPQRHASPDDTGRTEALAPIESESEPEPVRAPDTAPAAASDRRAATPQPERSVRASTRARRRRRRAHPVVTAAVWLGSLVGSALLLQFAYRQLTEPLPAARGPGPPARATPRSRGGDDAAWRALQTALAAGESPATALAALAARLERAGAQTAAEAVRAVQRRFVDRPAGEAKPARAALARALSAELRRLVDAQRFGTARALLEAARGAGLGELAPDTDAIAQAAHAAFASVRARARALEAAGDREGARALLLGFAARCDGLAVQNEAQAELRAMDEARLVEGTDHEDTATQRPPEDTLQARREAAVLRARAEQALRTLRWHEALEHWRALAALPAPPEAALEGGWGLLDSARVAALERRLLRALSADTPKRPVITLELAPGITARVTAADADGVRLEGQLGPGGGRVVDARRWRDMAPSTIYAILAGVPDPGPDELLALATYALRAGLETEAHAALVDLWQRFPAHRREALVLLGRFEPAALRTPFEAWTVFEGRLVPRAERERIEAERAAARERARELERELARRDAAARLERLFAEAQSLLEAGSYRAGRAALRAIARRDPDGAWGARARQRLADPVLRRRPLAVHGPERGRISFVLLAEGYPLDEAAQRRFDREAERAWRVLARSEPWAEYAGWCNAYAVNVWSREAGLDREPGGLRRDTVFGGIVRDGVFTVDRAAVAAVIDRWPGPKVAIVIGNGEARVATGGGGVCAIPRGMLDVTPHEVGHAFAELGDEYDEEPGRSGPPAPRANGPVPVRVLAPNLVAGNDPEALRANAPWRHWFALGERNWTGRPVDLFEGGGRRRYDVWRAQRDCRMRTPGAPFCVACMERMVVRIHEVLPVIDRREPTEAQLRIRAGERARFAVVALAPRRGPLEASFTLVRAADGDGSTEGRDDEAAEPLPGRGRPLPDGRVRYEVRTPPLEPGRYTVTATLSDPTAWVALPDRSALAHTVRWQVVVR